MDYYTSIPLSRVDRNSCVVLPERDCCLLDKDGSVVAEGIDGTEEFGRRVDEVVGGRTEEVVGGRTEEVVGGRAEEVVGEVGGRVEEVEGRAEDVVEDISEILDGNNLCWFLYL